MKDLRVVFITYYDFEGATLTEKNFDNSEDNVVPGCRMVERHLCISPPLVLEYVWRCRGQ